jgi:hypothetical protein
MLSFLKKIFGAKAAETKSVPYKVETPRVETTKVSEFPFPSAKPAKSVKKPAAKKPVEKKPGARKPRKPQTPK